MTLRLALAPPKQSIESVTVARAAEILCCDESTVRALVRRGGLEGSKVGKTDDDPRGVRVELQSVLDYKARHAIEPIDTPDDRPARRRRKRPSTAAHREAMALLRSLGSRL